MKIGSLVECTLDNWHVILGEKVPVKGNIYTVREVIERAGLVGLMFEEIINSVHKYDDATGETAFDSRGFRELQPPMDISQLIENLQTEPACH